MTSQIGESGLAIVSLACMLREIKNMTPTPAPESCGKGI